MKFTVDEDGIYDFGFRLMGWSSGAKRTTNIQLDNGDVYRMEADYEDSNKEVDQYYYGKSAKLSAGEHTMTFSLTDDFNDSDIKSLYICDILYTSKPIPVVEPEPEVPASAKTADVFSLALITMAVSAGAVLTIKAAKRK